MTIYVFGNVDVSSDSLALTAIPQLKKLFPEISFQTIQPNEDVPTKSPNFFALDNVVGIKKPVLLTEDDLENLVLPPRSSAHDYDLAFQLKYLYKLGKLKSIRIIGLPVDQPIDYDSCQSILRKLVAQDIQGS